MRKHILAWVIKIKEKKEILIRIVYFNDIYNYYNTYEILKEKTINTYFTHFTSFCLALSLNFNHNKMKNNHQKQQPRRFFKISVLFFQEQPLYNFPGRSICSLNRHKFSRRVFQTGMLFQRRVICSLNRPYYLIEQIKIFRIRIPYLVFEHIFSRKIPPVEQIFHVSHFGNRSRWLLSNHLCFPLQQLATKTKYFRQSCRFRFLYPTLLSDNFREKGKLNPVK